MRNRLATLLVMGFVIALVMDGSAWAQIIWNRNLPAPGGPSPDESARKVAVDALGTTYVVNRVKPFDEAGGSSSPNIEAIYRYDSNGNLMSHAGPTPNDGPVVFGPYGPVAGIAAHPRGSHFYLVEQGHMLDETTNQSVPAIAIEQWDLNSDDFPIWTRFSPGVPWDVAVNLNGSAYVVGSLNNRASITIYDSSGSFLAQRVACGDSSSLRAVAVGRDFTFYVVGYTPNPCSDFGSPLAPGPFLARLDVNFNPMWARNVDVQHIALLFGDADREDVLDVGIDEFNNAYVLIDTPEFQSSFDPPIFADPAPIVRKFDDSGNEVWTRNVSSENEHAHALSVSPLGEASVVGTVGPSSSSAATFVQTFGTDGTPEQEFRLDQTEGYAIAVSLFGERIIAGTAYVALPGEIYQGGASDGYVAKLGISQASTNVATTLVGGIVGDAGTVLTVLGVNADLFPLHHLGVSATLSTGGNVNVIPLTCQEFVPNKPRQLAMPSIGGIFYASGQALDRRFYRIAIRDSGLGLIGKPDLFGWEASDVPPPTADTVCGAGNFDLRPSSIGDFVTLDVPILTSQQPATQQ